MDDQLTREARPTNDSAVLDQVWYLALHCRMVLFAHAQLERLGLIEIGTPSSNPVEANYHQFAAVHLLATLCVVDSAGPNHTQGYLHHALRSLDRPDLSAPIQAILDRHIYSDVTFSEALRARRNYDRTHGNLFRPKQSITRPNRARSLQAYAATEVATGQEAFNNCWRQLVVAIGRLADALESEMERLAPPTPPARSIIAPELLPREGGAIGLHRPPRSIAISFDPPAVQEIVDWRLRSSDSAASQDRNDTGDPAS